MLDTPFNENRVTIFGVKLKTKRSESCTGCVAFGKIKTCMKIHETHRCNSLTREDGKSVIWVYETRPKSMEYYKD